jgi:uncharacterized protein
MQTMNKQAVLAQLHSHIGEIRQRFSVKAMSLFGSVARGEGTDASDVDVLVTFVGSPTFDGFMDLKFYLEDLLGTKVDLVTDKALRAEVRKAIQGELVNVA